MRHSGIEVIGDVPWGTHFCQFYEIPDDLVEILVPYFKAGLEANEFCLWVTSAPLQVREAKAALKAAVPDLDRRSRKGQIEILDYSQWYTRSGKFSAEEVLRGWVDKLNTALAKGFEGLRLTGNTFWLEPADWNDFAAYEKAVNEVIGRTRMLAACTYSLKKCRATEILDVMVNHEFALIKRQGRWEIVESARHRSTEQALKAEVAERSLAQTRLAESHQRLNTVLETIADGFYALDREWRFTLINDAALRHFGRKREELLGRSIFDVFPEVRGSVFEKSFREAMETVKPTRAQAPSVLMDKFMSIHAYPGPESMTVIFRDITERQRAEEALRASEQRQAAFAAATFEGIVLSEHGIILDCNEQFAQMAGAPVEKLKGTSIADIIAPEDRDRVTENILYDRESITEHSMLRKDGTRITVEAHGRPLSEAGDGRRLTAVRDVTERKRMEDSIRQSRADLSRAQAVARTGSWRLDVRRDELLWSEETYRIFGLPPGTSLTYEAFLAAVHPEDRAEVDAAWQSALRGRPYDIEHRIVAGEEIKWVREQAELEHDERGELLGGFGTVQDITDQRRREDELRQLNRVLTARSQSSLAMMKAEEQTAYLNEVCRIIVEACGHAMVWIGFAENDPDKTVQPVASAGFEEGYLETLRLTWADTERGRGPTGTAIRTGRPAGCENMLTDSNFSPWRGEALKRGYASSLALPLLGAGGAFGAITIYSRQPGAFSPDEVRLLGGLASDMSYGIAALRLRRAHREAEEALRQRSRELQDLTQTLEQRVRERTAQLSEANERLLTETAARLRLAAAVEQAAEGVVITDPRGVIEYVNPAFERMNELDGIDVRGQSYGRFLEGEGPEGKLRGKFEAALAAAKPWNVRGTRKRASGQTAELDVAVSLIRDETGRVTNFLAVERDVTEQVRLQQHLRQTQKTEALGTLAGGIAHDLNNILNPIFINTELILLDAPLDDRMRQSLEMTLRAAERGRDLVKQIITFSRQKEKERRPVKVAPLVRESLKFLRSSVPKLIEIRESLGQETGQILADPVQVHQVIMNLCSNAAHAMRDCGGVLEVGLTELDVDDMLARRHPDLRPGPYLRLTVADSGVGMSSEVIERAFDPFFTTKAPGEGSGMGLAVVQGIVRDHGGAISVYSEAGHGSTFNVFFPLIRGPEIHLDASPGGITGGRERILLIDDEEAQALSVARMLERLGYDLTTRTDPLEALDLFRREPGRFDLVITDQAMPRMMGARLAEEILKIRPDLPVILCTGFSEQVDANGAKKRGLREFLMKPFSLREISEVIRRALESGPPRPAP
jgi:PAS domain S-box-containing protein